MTPKFNYHGEYSCKLDAKGRLKLPAGLVEQLGGMPMEIIMNRGVEDCLRIFSSNAWEQKTKELINRLNPNNSKHRTLARYINRGVTKLSVDSNGRILIPKTLMEFAGLEREVIVSGNLSEIEIWSKDRYENGLEWDQDAYSSLLDEVLGDDDTISDGLEQLLR